MRRVFLKAAAVAIAGMLAVANAAPASAFDAYWFTQRGRNLRAGSGADDDPAQRRVQRQQEAPQQDRCAAQRGGGQRRAEGCY